MGILTGIEALERLSGRRDPSRSLRIALVVAHPDDEVIGAGAQLPGWPDAHFIHVTDGAPRDMLDAKEAGFTTRAGYAQARRAELESALSLAGAERTQLWPLQVTDQEASRHLTQITHALTELFQKLRPDLVITHPYEGGHPDHDATAFAVHAATRLLKQLEEPAPCLVEMTSYHNRAGLMAAGLFLPHAGAAVASLKLSAGQKAFKQALFDCFTTQRKVLAGFPINREQFRLAPNYDFTRPPHDGILYYEMFDWGMRGAEWRTRARRALAELQLGESYPIEAQPACVPDHP